MGKHSWDTNDVIRLFDAVKKHGKKWDVIANKMFRGVSAKGLRNMYYKILRENEGVFSETSGDQVSASFASRYDVLKERDYQELEKYRLHVLQQVGLNFDGMESYPI